MPIRFQFDVRVVALFIAMTFFVQATAIGAQAFLIRELKPYRGVNAALLANLCVAVGLFIRLYNERLPEFLTLVVSNILVQAGPALFYVALSQFTGLSYSKTLVLGLIGSVFVSLVYFTYWQDEISMRLIVLALGSIAMALILIHQLWRTLKTPLRFSASLMLVSFLFHGLFLIVRTASLLMDPPDTASITPAQSATYLLSFAISFFWSTGFVLMVSHRLRNDLMEIATVDVLTHIPNRRATQAFFEKELSRVKRHTGEFSILLIDIDNFKQVNDRWGHATGDFVLAETARLFQETIRKQDWVGRWGGEEFLMILPGSSLTEAASLAERVRSDIAAREYRQGTASLRITISMGVACTAGADRIDQVLKKADDALYTSKANKNIITVAE
ncbi:MAG TPA: GGDEF domain-containing protein [Anaerolineales bacterium]|nr:GGDEF domain-containing protein [Anaerolineales bacterium]